MTTDAVPPGTTRSPRRVWSPAEPVAAADDAIAKATGPDRGDTEYVAKHRLMLAELGLAANRIGLLEEKGIRPRARVAAMTSHVPADFFAAVGEHTRDSRLHHIEKFKLKPPTAHPVPTALPQGLWQSFGVEQMNLKLPPRDAPHTMDVQSYIANRLSKVATEKIKAIGAEIFLGTAQELQNWCAHEGWTSRGQLGAPSSSEFMYLQRGSEEKMMITGIASNARLVHQVLMLHFAGVDTDTLQVRGDMATLQGATLDRLSKHLAMLPDIADKICFFGARRQVSRSIQGLLGEEHGMRDISLSPVTTCAVDSFSFDHMILESPDRRVLLIGFRMPNGDLAEGSVNALLSSGVSNIVMCGAGGSLDPQAGIGDYIQIDTAYHNDDRVAPPANALMAAPGPTSLPYRAVNITVDSPLEETEAWLAEATTQAECVDVESAHVFRGFAAHMALHPESDAKLLAGMFVSDVVGHQPLNEKISSGVAYAGINRFIGNVLTELGVLP